MKKKILNFEVFYENHHPTRHIKYKRIDFAASNNHYGELPYFNQFVTISRTD